MRVGLELRPLTPLLVSKTAVGGSGSTQKGGRQGREAVEMEAA